MVMQKGDKDALRSQPIGRGATMWRNPLSTDDCTGL